MTPSEFKAWFDGFTEAFTGTPTKAQWSRIKARVAEIDGKPVTERIYVDRYWPTYLNYRPPIWATTGIGISTGGVGVSAVGQYMVATNCANSTAAFSSHDAMNALGRAEAESLAA